MCKVKSAYWSIILSSVVVIGLMGVEIIREPRCDDVIISIESKSTLQSIFLSVRWQIHFALAIIKHTCIIKFAQLVS